MGGAESSLRMKEVGTSREENTNKSSGQEEDCDKEEMDVERGRELEEGSVESERVVDEEESEEREVKEESDEGEKQGKANEAGGGGRAGRGGKRSKQVPPHRKEMKRKAREEKHQHTGNNKQSCKLDGKEKGNRERDDRGQVSIRKNWWTNGWESDER